MRIRVDFRRRFKEGQSLHGTGRVLLSVGRSPLMHRLIVVSPLPRPIHQSAARTAAAALQDRLDPRLLSFLDRDAMVPAT